LGTQAGMAGLFGLPKREGRDFWGTQRSRDICVLFLAAFVPQLGLYIQSSTDRSQERIHILISKATSLLSPRNYCDNIRLSGCQLLRNVGKVPPNLCLSLISDPKKGQPDQLAGPPKNPTSVLEDVFALGRCSSSHLMPAVNQSFCRWVVKISPPITHVKKG